MAKPFLKAGIIALCAAPAVAGAAVTTIEVLQPQETEDFYIKDKDVTVESGTVTFTLYSKDGKPHILRNVTLITKSGQIAIIEVQMEGKQVDLTWEIRGEVKQETPCEISFYVDSDEDPTVIKGLTFSPNPSPVVEDFYLNDITVNLSERNTIAFKINPPKGQPTTITDVKLFGANGASIAEPIASAEIPAEGAILKFSPILVINQSIEAYMIFNTDGNIKKTISNLVINPKGTDRFLIEDTAKEVTQEKDKDGNYFATFGIKCEQTYASHTISPNDAILVDSDSDETYASNKVETKIDSGAGTLTLVFKGELKEKISNLTLKLKIDSATRTAILTNIGRITVNPPQASADFEIEQKNVTLNDKGQAVFVVKCNKKSETPIITQVDLYDVSSKKEILLSTLTNVKFKLGDNTLEFPADLSGIIKDDTPAKMVIQDKPACTIDGLTLSPAPVVDNPFDVVEKQTNEQSNEKVYFKIKLGDEIEGEYTITKATLNVGTSKADGKPQSTVVSKTQTPEIEFDTKEIKIESEVSTSIELEYEGGKKPATISGLSILPIIEKIFSIKNTEVEYHSESKAVQFVLVNHEYISHLIQAPIKLLTDQGVELTEIKKGS